MDNQQALDSFLASVEKKAFQLAEFAVADKDEALDLVQNSMIKLVQKYSDRDPEQWILLFYRILHNEIKDWKRKAWVRGWLGMNDDQVEVLPDHSVAVNPEQLCDAEVINEQMHKAIRALPMRQQQAFLLRVWEGLDVKQTAQVMQCTPGSVKTHYSRALERLRLNLTEWGYEA